MIQNRICQRMRTGIFTAIFYYKILIINKINLKKIWIIDFFDFIFAEENLKKEFQYHKEISKYNTAYKMNFNYKIYSVELQTPGLDHGCFTAQVHEYRQ